MNSPADRDAPQSRSQSPLPAFQPHQSSNPPKPPPCDQCRRRKVRCDTGTPCDRCVSSGLRCTRDIVRKRRGPKKGSGSVIAKLRNQDGDLSSFDLPHSDLPMLQRTLSGESSLSGYGPTSDPSSMAGLGAGRELLGLAAPTSTRSQLPLLTPPGMEFPLLKQFPPLQYPSPSSNDGYVSVNDLAHQIFDGPDPSLAIDVSMMSLQGSTGRSAGSGNVLAPSPLVTSVPTAISSPSVHSVSSPHNYDGPKFLYRHNSSGPLQVELQVANLANEVGMSAYLMSQCVTQFFRHLYPVMPVLHEPSFCRRLTLPEELSDDEKGLLLSVCAVTVLHAAPVSDLDLDGKKNLGLQFLSHTLYLRNDPDWVERASAKTIMTSFFMSVSFFELKKLRSHHFYLREAIGIAHEQGLHLESIPERGQMEAIFNRRIFALLFVTERGLGILRNKPVTIARLDYLPVEHLDDENPSILAGFQCLCRLFALLDENFVEFWRTSSIEDDEDVSIQLESITSIQHGLSAMSFEKTVLTDVQKADVMITHQWLRLIFWQASMRRGFVSSSSRDVVFSYEYPIVIAKVLCQIMNQLSMDSILVHGLGIFEKIFEVAYTLMDALTIAKLNWSESEELRFLFACLSASPNSHNTYVHMLETKMVTQQTPLLDVSKENHNISSAASMDLQQIRSNG